MPDELVDADAVERGLRNLGLGGRAVCVHSSLRSFGHLGGGAPTFIDACLAAGCTVLVPTFSWEAFAVPAPADLRPARNGTDYGWRPVPTQRDPYSPSSRELDVDEMGLIPAAVLDHPDHLRGDHPLCSFSAVGPDATTLVADQTWADVYAPLRALVLLDGAVLMVGVDLTAMTLLHLAEAAAGRVPFQRWALGADGHVHAVAVGGCSDGFNALGTAIDHLRATIDVGPSRWDAYPAAPALAAATRAIETDPESTICPDRCQRCLDARDGGPTIAS